MDSVSNSHDDGGQLHLKSTEDHTDNHNGGMKSQKALKSKIKIGVYLCGIMSFLNS